MGESRKELFAALEAGMCHLWYWRPDSLTLSHVERGLALLSPDELARHRRFLVPDPARTFLAARVLVRSLLSAYCSLSPTEWKFETNAWGRPHFVNPEAPAGLTFNLSHKPGFVTCLTGCHRELGVDVEDLSAGRPHLLDIAERFFSRAESAALRSLPEGQQRDRFYQLWTLKEAYIKARGQGLSLGLSRFSFRFHAAAIGVDFDPELEDDARSWEFRLFHPDASHLIATAVRSSGREPIHIVLRDAASMVASVLEER